jgi:hypothetical protein
VDYLDPEKVRKQMNARKVAAQFAAYVWFENNHKTENDSDAPVKFAEENWQFFLPIANPGVGKLLLKIAGVRPSKGRNRNRLACRELAAVE